MSVYIKGMEMPECCAICKLYEGNLRCAVTRFPFYSEERFERRMHDCPLVPVPPHGRLIDADAYSAEMKKRQDACAEWRDNIKNGGGYGTELYYRADSSLAGFIEARLTLDKIPTIIEAEEGSGKYDI